MRAMCQSAATGSNRELALSLCLSRHNADLCFREHIATLCSLAHSCRMESRVVIRQPRQLGALIQTARQRQGLTQHQLASLAGMQQRTISVIETGHDGLRLDTLLRVLAVLQLDLAALSRAGADTPD